jgi:hypothetical protein
MQQRVVEAVNIIPVNQVAQRKHQQKCLCGDREIDANDDGLVAGMRAIHLPLISNNNSAISR